MSYQHNPELHFEFDRSADADPPQDVDECVALAERILAGSYRPELADARLDALSLAWGTRVLAAQLAAMTKALDGWQSIAQKTEAKAADPSQDVDVEQAERLTGYTLSAVRLLEARGYSREAGTIRGLAAQLAEAQEDRGRLALEAATADQERLKVLAQLAEAREQAAEHLEWVRNRDAQLAERERALREWEEHGVWLHGRPPPSNLRATHSDSEETTPDEGPGT